MRLKQCKKCKQELPTSMFYKSSYTKDGFRDYCKECCKQNNKNYYVKHRTEIIERTKQYVDNNKEKIKEYQNQYSYVHRDDRKEYQKILFDDKREFLNSLKYPCVKCGEDRPWIIDFHHINPKNKCFTVGNKYRGNIEVIQAEVEKMYMLM